VHDSSNAILPGFSAWREAGFEVLSRTLTLPIQLPAILPEKLPVLIPDLAQNQTDSDDPSGNYTIPEPDRFLFFDLETTGLSTGTGTLAFLAAFGRFIRDTNAPSVPFSGLEITQFLLLDYPGEPDFLEKTLLFIFPDDSKELCYLTTYNGKAFDTQILKTRCTVHNRDLPPFLQVDLLHPARRLWKRTLPNCSLGTIETLALGLDRSGDTPGSLAPKIWLNFLNSNEEESCRALAGICDHNVKDIFGLSSLFCAFTEIASSPLEAPVRFGCDEENLALAFRQQNHAQ
jgi:uncharacterized protein YprB with RNaseH-like and TPR domain